MQSTDISTNLAFYQDMYAWGGATAMGLGWESRKLQWQRFDILLRKVSKLHDISILDVGCGYADLYDYLGVHYPNANISYTGIDIHPRAIAECLRRFSTYGIDVRTLELMALCGTWDTVLASGTFNVRVSDNYRYLYEQVYKMIQLARRNVTFNITTLATPIAQRHDDVLFYYDTAIVAAYCRKFGRVHIQSTPIAGESTITIIK